MVLRSARDRPPGDRVLHAAGRGNAVGGAGGGDGGGAEGARRPPPASDRQPAAARERGAGLRLRGTTATRALSGHRQPPPQAAARGRAGRARDPRHLQLLQSRARCAGLRPRRLRVTGRPHLARRAAAEAIGAFALVFAGCGAIVTEAEHPGTLGTVGIAFVFGLVIMAMVYATGHLSGAHLNPAVTLAFTLTRHLPAREAVSYMGAQLLGAIAAAALLLAIWPSEPAALGATMPTVGAG